MSGPTEAATRTPEEHWQRAAEVVDSAILSSTTADAAQKVGAAARQAKRQAALYHAAYHGDLQVIQKHVARGADLTWRHPQGGASALYVACENGHHEAVRLLLASGAPADQARDDGSTPLFVSVSMACEQPEDGGGKDQAKLALAPGGRRLQIVQALLSAGATPDLTVKGLAPLWVACHHSAPRVVWRQGATTGPPRPSP